MNRKWLIDILDCLCVKIDCNKALYFTYEESEKLADYLIENGVFVSPVSLGDKIYEIISPKDREPYFITATVCAVHIADGSRNSCQRKRESYIVAECPGTKYVHKYPISKFGKTVFTTIQEAEMALKIKMKEREEQCNAPTANASSLL
ncbi:MAG: hypothetical protein ACI4KF_01260 [Huintestinicola sp.]